MLMVGSLNPSIAARVGVGDKMSDLRNRIVGKAHAYREYSVISNFNAKFYF